MSVQSEVAALRLFIRATKTRVPSDADRKEALITVDVLAGLIEGAEDALARRPKRKVNAVVDVFTSQGPGVEA